MSQRLTPQIHEAIVSHLRAGNYPEVAARAAGVDPIAYDAWVTAGADPCSVYAAFRRDCESAIAAAESELVGHMLRAAAVDHKAGAWLLERRTPERWAMRVVQTVHGELQRAIDRIEALEPHIGREALDRVMDALAGDPVR